MQSTARFRIANLAGELSGKYDLPRAEILAELAAAIDKERSGTMAFANAPDHTAGHDKPERRTVKLTADERRALVRLGLDPDYAEIGDEADLRELEARRSAERSA
jgi:hypothetical protein